MDIKKLRDIIGTMRFHNVRQIPIDINDLEGIVRHVKKYQLQISELETEVAELKAKLNTPEPYLTIKDLP